MISLSFPTLIRVSIWVVFFLYIPTSTSVAATVYSDSELATARYFASIKHDSKELDAFLVAMPKGADLHSHLAGASWAESMIHYAKGDSLCTDPKTLAVNKNPHCVPKYRLKDIYRYPKRYNALIDAWSMRNFHSGQESGHDHFFAAFEKYAPIPVRHSGEMLSEVVERACRQNIIYLELMVTPDNNASGNLGRRIGWDSHLVRLRERLLKYGLKAVVRSISKQLDKDEAMLRRTTQSKGFCSDIEVRYLYQVLREQPPVQVFAQLLAGFELASRDPRVVGINMVQAEDGKIAMRDYSLHMHMLRFLHRFYPQVSISLHAGELVPGLVPINGLRFHIREAVEIAQAQRIGHGVDILYEERAESLLKEMAKKRIMVEINLSSNALILGVKGKNHPLLSYWRYGVPIALSTDDEGVLRTNLTQEYKKAILNYGFSYLSIKKLVRNSLHYSFLPGHSLWCDDHYHSIVAPCKRAINGLSSQCKRFLDTHPKAYLEWKLEKRFSRFENQFS